MLVEILILIGVIVVSYIVINIITFTIYTIYKRHLEKKAEQFIVPPFPVDQDFVDKFNALNGKDIEFLLYDDETKSFKHIDELINLTNEIHSDKVKEREILDEVKDIIKDIIKDKNGR